jgi:hypothetical protein
MHLAQGFGTQARIKMARKQTRVAEIVDEGGPARSLAIAPDALRCSTLVTARAGGTSRCTRYTVKKPDGTRTTCCVAHSDDEDVLRRRLDARDKLRKQREEAAAQRTALSQQVLPELPTTTRAVQEARFRLARLVLERRVTTREAAVVRDLLRDSIAQQNCPPMWES